MRTAALAGLLAAAVALPGCPASGTCTTNLVPSVSVNVIDAAGEPVRDATVRYIENGGPEQDAECSYGVEPACDEWIAGWETQGIFLLKATSADGSRHAEKTVLVKADECHVRTQQVTLQLL